MNSAEFIEILSSLPASEEVNIQCGYGSFREHLKIYSRDILEMDGYSTNVKSVRAVTEITSETHHGPVLGFARLTPEVEKRVRRDILYRMSNKFSPGTRGRECFELNGNDFRIFADYGDSQDRCYGISYDPRVWNALVSEGLLKELVITGTRYNRTDYEITDAGIDALKILDEG